MSTIPFFLVWRDGGHTPMRQQPDEGVASNEAARLARANPGETFYVLAPVKAVQIRDLDTQVFVDLNDLPVPF